jgi:hypothetical protein
MNSLVNWFVNNFFWIQLASIIISLVLIIAIVRLIIKIDYYSDKREYGLEIWQIKKLRHKKLKKLWKKVLALVVEPDPVKWKEVLIEVDNFFDDTLKEIGYLGESAKERLLKVEKEKISNIEEIIKIHEEVEKIKASDSLFLEHEKVKEYLRAYRQAFRQLGYLD